MNVRTLKADDFPGIDRAKFEEWKTLKAKENKSAALAMLAGLGAWKWFEESKRMKQLARELDMRKRLRCKRKGLVYQAPSSPNDPE
jgi:hypothetical protein